ncbi:type II toxin-antitoxin system RelE/ParE family toxin [Candidatus Magnetominusculus xianensis]|uniref:Plasmid stabilization protein n=1 Tax=Candidatus Magnetominusculus xianensis TaxID=1748249 RepID=A0ABR5SF31_9BACT|nr:plasmid stabilization protein [Candidatus Magnetominusculus xianensis]
MKYKVQYPKSFSKRTFKLSSNNPILKNAISKVFLKLEENPFDQSLDTHKLSGNLKDRYSCFVTRDIRITFRLSDNIISLLNIGSHDEVY